METGILCLLEDRDAEGGGSRHYIPSELGGQAVCRQAAGPGVAGPKEPRETQPRETQEVTESCPTVYQALVKAFYSNVQ